MRNIIVEKLWPNQKETLIISVKLQPNVILSQLDAVISVRNRISRIKKLCIIKPIWRIRHFVDLQTINEDPRLAVNIVMAYKATHASQTLHSLHIFPCTHTCRIFKKILRLLSERSLHNNEIYLSAKASSESSLSEYWRALFAFSQNFRAKIGFISYQRTRKHT